MALRYLALVRHGDYVKYGSDYCPLPEDEQLLTQKGVRQIASTAEQLHRVLHKPVRILSSPALRALQSAVLIAERFGLEDEVLARGCLSIESFKDTQRAKDEVQGWVDATVGDIKSLVLVGHQELLKDFATYNFERRTKMCVDLPNGKGYALVFDFSRNPRSFLVIPAEACL